jgi:hypothetical protein
MTALPAETAGVEPWFVETSMFTTEDPAKVAGQLRGISGEIDPLAQFTAIAPKADAYGSLRTGLGIGSTLVLLMLAVGLLVQAIVPVSAGLTLAVGAGARIGAMLMRFSEVPIRFGAAAILTPIAAGAGLVLCPTIAVLLPPLAASPGPRNCVTNDG